MTIEDANVDKSLKRRLLIPTLLLCEFAVFSFSVFLSVLLLDVAHTFKVPLGTASQLGTLTRIVGIFVGLVMSALALKFKTKTIFLGGIIIYAIGVLGSFWAPNFTAMLVFSPIVGAGSILTGVMIIVLIGELLPLQRRGWVIGLVTGASFTSNVLIPQISTQINLFAGWRFFLLWFLLPISIVGLVLGWYVVQSKPILTTGEKPEYARAYKKILANKSALSCIVAAALFGFGMSLGLYLTSFYRIHFSVTPSMVAVFYSSVSFVAILASVTCGRLINRVGRKLLTIVPAVICGLTTILMVLVPALWISVALWFINASTAAMAQTALHGLQLEQVPELRGSNMSLGSMFRYTGLALGPFVGGIALNIYHNNFVLIFTLFGIATIATGAVVALLAKDPCRIAAIP